MDILSLLLTILGIIVAIIFGYLQVIVPFIKRDVRFSRHFPFVESAEAAVAAKPRRRVKKKRKRFLIPGLAIGILIIIFVLIRFLVFQARAIERVPIAVINFTNRTGDRQFDYLCEAIPNLLITNLEQSKHLSIMTWERMHDLLKILGKEDVRVVDEELGFEICAMDDIKTIVIGSFTKAGDMFVTEAKVLDVKTKKLLKSSSSDGVGIASILQTQIDELSKDIARGVSRYERVIETTKFEITEVTTSSMEAYNYFLRGREEFGKWYFDEARKFLERAIEIDSTFASAYLYLALTYHWPDEENLGTEPLEKARRLSHMATERERFFIEAMYALLIEKKSEKELQIYRQWATKYPKDKWAHTMLGLDYNDRQIFDKAVQEYTKALELDPNFGYAWNNLGYIYAKMGDYDKAIECFKRYAAVFPGDANPFDSMGDLYFQRGQLDEALVQYKEAIFTKPDFLLSCTKIVYIYALREDYAEAMKWVDHYITFAPSLTEKAGGYRLKASYSNLLGNFDQAMNALDTVKELVEPNEWESCQRAYTDWSRGWLYYDMRKYELSRNCFRDSYDTLFLGWDSAMAIIDYNFPLGLVDVKQENPDSARARLATIKSLLPNVRTSSKNMAQLVHDILYAEILLAQNSLAKVIVMAEAISQWQVDRVEYANQTIMIQTKDIAARTYLKKGDIDKAILEYERLTDPDPNKRGRCLIRPTWHYELAKLYEEKGLKAKTIGQYEKFLDIWKNADADRPELTDAKERLAKLKTKK